MRGSSVGFGDTSEGVAHALRLPEERDRSEHPNAVLAVELEQARQGEPVELTPELFEEIRRRVDEMILHGGEPDPDVCPQSPRRRGQVWSTPSKVV